MTDLEDPTGRLWQWGFSNVVTTTVDGLEDVIVSMDVTLTLTDYDLDKRQVNAFPCTFDSPDSGDFIPYEELTPENLKEWALLKYCNPDMGWSKGRAAWIARQKEKMVVELEKRHNHQYRVIKSVIEETE
jgi:hypothetical protein